MQTSPHILGRYRFADVTMRVTHFRQEEVRMELRAKAASDAPAPGCSLLVPALTPLPSLHLVQRRQCLLFGDRLLWRRLDLCSKAQGGNLLIGWLTRTLRERKGNMIKRSQFSSRESACPFGFNR